MRISSIAFAAALTVLGTSASAQLAPGYSGDSSAPIPVDKSQIWVGMRMMGRCLATTKAEKAKAFLNSQVDSASETAAFRALFNKAYNACLRDFVSINARRAHIRGVVAEGLYEVAMEQGFTAHLKAASQTFGDGQAVKNLHDFAKCYVAARSDQVHKMVVETRLGTNEEKLAMRAMAGEFGNCFPEGLKITIQPVEFRMALVEALYHASGHGAAATRK